LQLLGHQNSTGDAFTYEIVLKNKNLAETLGMSVSILRVPTCLEINFNLLDSLMSNKVFDYYEVRNSNQEIVIYWKSFGEGEEKKFNIDLLQRYSGDCY
jgi:hypothetical protein